MDYLARPAVTPVQERGSLSFLEVAAPIPRLLADKTGWASRPAPLIEIGWGQVGRYGQDAVRFWQSTPSTEERVLRVPAPSPGLYVVGATLVEVSDLAVCFLVLRLGAVSCGSADAVLQERPSAARAHKQLRGWLAAVALELCGQQLDVGEASWFRYSTAVVPHADVRVRADGDAELWDVVATCDDDVEAAQHLLEQTSELVLAVLCQRIALGVLSHPDHQVCPSGDDAPGVLLVRRRVLSDLLNKLVFVTLGSRGDLVQAYRTMEQGLGLRRQLEQLRDEATQAQVLQEMERDAVARVAAAAAAQSAEAEDRRQRRRDRGFQNLGMFVAVMALFPAIIVLEGQDLHTVLRVCGAAMGLLVVIEVLIRLREWRESPVFGGSSTPPPDGSGSPVRLLWRRRPTSP